MLTLKTIRHKARFLRKKISNNSSVLNTLALVIIGLLAVMADYQVQRLREQNDRADVQSSLSLVRAKLEGNIRFKVSMYHGATLV